ncbi:MAG: hypothetical protein QXH27_01890, partial [Candidatus Micrarchaeia archaeon]
NRSEAAVNLAKSFGNRSVRVLEKAFEQEKDEDVRTSIACALRAVGTWKAYRALARLMRKTDLEAEDGKAVLDGIIRLEEVLPRWKILLS